jgi:hypothetical protein
MDVIAPALGAILGSAPDTFDWIGAKLGLFPRWWLYNILHHTTPAIIFELLLIAPGIHVLFDFLVHAPVIPDPSDTFIVDYDLVLFRLFGKPIRRRHIQWITGELLLVTLATLLYVST